MCKHPTWRKVRTPNGKVIGYQCTACGHSESDEAFEDGGCRKCQSQRKTDYAVHRDVYPERKVI